MYKISVPVSSRNVERSDRNKLLIELKKLNAERIFISTGAYELDLEERKKEFALLKENIDFFKKEGFEVGVWLWTFMLAEANDFTKMVSLDGKIVNSEICPLDENFRKFAGEYVRDIAMLGADMIMFDDDFRFGFYASKPCCACEKHLERISGILGEEITGEELCEKVFNGKANEYRDAWIKVNGEALTEYAKYVREKVDEVNPKIRMGLCACMTKWDIDGADPDELNHILAGENKPFMRLIGAPYWAAGKRSYNDSNVQNVIDYERMQRSWMDDETEYFAEGDVFPRPRTSCPASFLELFDTAMRADGLVDGILKYAIDYTSTAHYETGYTARHVRNRDIYDKIDKYFADKDTVGVRVYEYPHLFSGCDMTRYKAIENASEYLFFPVTTKLLSDNSIPITFYGKGVCGAVLGENAKYISEDELFGGIITDLRGAEILTERGIDVGIKSIGEKTNYVLEYFKNQNEYTILLKDIYKLDLDKDVKVLSCAYSKPMVNPDDSESENAVAYLYENKQGQRFMVFAFDMYFGGPCNTYARSLQIKEAIPWLSGKKLPAYCANSPELYTMCKADENSMAVGLWNMFADCVIEPTIELDKEYSEISFINCTGCLERDKVYLSDIPAYEFAGFFVK